LAFNSASVSSKAMNTPGSPNCTAPAHEEFRAQQRLAATGAAADQRGAPLRQPAAGDFVETLDAGGAFGQKRCRGGGFGPVFFIRRALSQLSSHRHTTIGSEAWGLHLLAPVCCVLGTARAVCCDKPAPADFSERACSHIRAIGWFLTPFAGGGCAPLPVPDLRQVLAVLVDVALVLDQLLFEPLLQAEAGFARLRQPVDRVHHEVEAVQVVQHRHVEGVVMVPSSL